MMRPDRAGSLTLRRFAALCLFAWLALSAWLDNFAYRTSISPWLFVLGGVLVLLIAFATTLYQSLRAAVSNPVDNLRNE